MGVRTTPATTPSQTVGPFYALEGGMVWPDGPEIVPADAAGAFIVRGQVFDGANIAVPDAIVEFWQADGQGRFAQGDPRELDTTFRGLGRCATDAEGGFWFRTVKPGSLPTPAGKAEAPHINVSVLARGLLHRLVTRIYFPDEEEANADDPVLTRVDAERRRTLVAERTPEGVRFDIRLQGEGETVFFAL
ncbi:protocatechuate 3,4-dioxygenase subunit alpha [Parasphingorhabdus pacifica]